MSLEIEFTCFIQLSGLDTFDKASTAANNDINPCTQHQFKDK
jgi:hypothetical protein